MEVHDLMWRHALTFVSKDDFVASLDGWKIEPVVVDGEPAFAMLIKGPEFHFQSFGTGHKIPLRLFRDRLQGLIDRYGYATTKTPKGDTKQQRFNERFLGGVVVGEDHFDLHYRLESTRGAHENAVAGQTTTAVTVGPIPDPRKKIEEASIPRESGACQ